MQILFSSIASQYALINAIDAALNFHPYYLSRLTMQYFGITPYRYLLQCRVEEAVRMLIETDRMVGEIATDCGFTSLPHFSAVICRRTGMSPSMLRKNGRGQPLNLLFYAKNDCMEYPAELRKLLLTEHES